MKKYIIPLVVIFSVALSGCYKEEPIVAELESYWRDYDVNSADPAFKMVSQYFEKYDKVLLYDAEVRDYVYNFQSKNDVEIENPAPDKVYEKLLLLDELFLKGYSDSLKKNLFPFNVIIADSITYSGGLNPASREMHSATNFLAFRITDKMLSYDAVQKKTLSNQMNSMFVLDYCIGFGKVALSPKFYEVSAAWYSKRDDNTTEQKFIDAAHKEGLLYIDSKWNAWQEAWLTDYASRERDPKDYLNLLLIAPADSIERLRKTYPKIDVKINYYVDMLESLGIDYTKIK